MVIDWNQFVKIHWSIHLIYSVDIFENKIAMEWNHGNPVDYLNEFQTIKKMHQSHICTREENKSISSLKKNLYLTSSVFSFEFLISNCTWFYLFKSVGCWTYIGFEPIFWLIPLLMFMLHIFIKKKKFELKLWYRPLPNPDLRKVVTLQWLCVGFDFCWFLFSLLFLNVLLVLRVAFKRFFLNENCSLTC